MKSWGLMVVERDDEEGEGDRRRVAAATSKVWWPAMGDVEVVEKLRLVRVSRG